MLSVQTQHTKNPCGLHICHPSRSLSVLTQVVSLERLWRERASLLTSLGSSATPSAILSGISHSLEQLRYLLKNESQDRQQVTQVPLLEYAAAKRRLLLISNVHMGRKGRISYFILFLGKAAQNTSKETLSGCNEVCKKHLSI